MDDDFMRWYEEHCKKVDCILTKDDLLILNAKQCRHLVKKLKLVVDWVLKKTFSSGGVEGIEGILKDVHRLVFKAFSLVEECGGEDLFVSALFQLENEESFRELLLELECCFKATYAKVQSKDEINSIDFGMASTKDVQYDRENFKRILESSKIALALNKSPMLIDYLLQRLKDLDDVKGGELNALKFADCGMFEKGRQLGEVGGDGSVFESKWIGLTCATKVLNNPQGSCDEMTMVNFQKESSILASLNHPNLVRFIGMGKDDDGWPFLMMEKMDTSVKNLLSEHTLGGCNFLPYDILLDVIQQIASGMYYLHDMHVAHRDLKPANILWTPLREKEQSLASSSSFGYIKLTDFGISKTEVGSESFEPDSMGTSVYRAPEVLRAYAKGNANYFQADVYSFGITCAEILCGRLSFEQEQPKNFSRGLYEKVKVGMCPDLPSFCGDLNTLVRECCAFNPSGRPTFSEIWKRLTTMKFNYLVGHGLHSPISFSSKV
jgi:tRNA A-37 threonylcarbamoyl transferase component Bud32